MSVAHQPRQGQPRTSCSAAVNSEVHTDITARASKGKNFAVERLGTTGEIARQVRTWHVEKPCDWDNEETFDGFPALECLGASPFIALCV